MQPSKYNLTFVELLIFFVCSNILGHSTKSQPSPYISAVSYLKLSPFGTMVLLLRLTCVPFIC